MRDPHCPIPGQRPEQRRGDRTRTEPGDRLVRHTELWARLEAALGRGYAGVWADQHVMADLGERTVRQALAAGEDPKVVWRAVWAALELPASQR